MKSWLAIALLVVVAEAKSIVAPVTTKVEDSADQAAQVETVTDLAVPVTAVADPQKIALELLRLQQELGGSVVTDQFPPTPDQLAEPSQPEKLDESLWHDDPQEQIEALREASRFVEEAAYSLERLDLYRQADELRGAARRLRADARRARTSCLQGGS